MQPRTPKPLARAIAQAPAHPLTYQHIMYWLRLLNPSCPEPSPPPKSITAWKAFIRENKPQSLDLTPIHGPITTACANLICLHSQISRKPTENVPPLAHIHPLLTLTSFLKPNHQPPRDCLDLAHFHWDSQIRIPHTTSAIVPWTLNSLAKTIVAEPISTIIQPENIISKPPPDDLLSSHFIAQILSLANIPYLPQISGTQELLGRIIQPLYKFARACHQYHDQNSHPHATTITSLLTTLFPNPPPDTLLTATAIAFALALASTIPTTTTNPHTTLTYQNYTFHILNRTKTLNYSYINDPDPPAN